MKETTDKLVLYLANKKENNQSLVTTIQGLGKFMGVSHQLIYNRFENHDWSETDILALSELFKVKDLKGKRLTNKIKSFLKENKKKKRKGYWTRSDAAKHLKISTSLLFQRMKLHNWNDNEKLKIEKL
jgi:hypothetical protein